MEIGGADGKGHLLAQVGALALEGRRGAQRSVEGQVLGLALGGAGLDVAAVFAVGVGARAPPRALAVQPVQGGIELAGGEGFAGLYFLAAVPPVGVADVKNTLRSRVELGRATLLFLPGFPAYAFFFRSAGSDLQG